MKKKKYISSLYDLQMKEFPKMPKVKPPKEKLDILPFMGCK